ALLRQGLIHLLVKMAPAKSKNPAEKIQIFFSLRVINIVVLRMVYDQRFVIVCRDTREEIFFLLFNDFVFVHKLPIRLAHDLNDWNVLNDLNSSALMTAQKIQDRRGGFLRPLAPTTMRARRPHYHRAT